MLDKAKIEFLKSIRQKIDESVQLTGDDMEMFSYFYGAGTGTQLGVASIKTSIDLVLALKERIMISACYTMGQTPEFRNCPSTGSRQVQYLTSTNIIFDNISKANQSVDHGLVQLMLLTILDVLIAQEELDASEAH